MVTLSTAPYTLAVNCAVSDLNDPVQPDKPTGAGALTASRNTIGLLQHFQSVTSVTLGDSPVQQVMNTHVAQSAWENPYLMHMLLAVSSAHLKWLRSATKRLQESRLYAIAEAEHGQTGLSLYQAALVAAGSGSEQNMDALISTTFLSVIFAFRLEDQVSSNAFSTDYDTAVAHALGPLAAGSGIIALGEAFRVLDCVAWMPVIRRGDDRFGSYTNQAPGIEGLPSALVDLCDLDEQSTSENSEYYSVVRALAPLLRLGPSIDHFSKLIAFGDRKFSLLRPLLRRRDAKALLLLSYWLGLLRRLDQWWLNVRTSSLCLAVVEYLLTIPHPKIHALLSYPASCGQGDLGYLWY
ncbi:hypothetical protein LTR62_002508 [Meristemomyces frigidus]|uniref:C6 transcription factor n=1 Tax=Meristemomyces frigidus TaxID=1508187 RepID=A0AAN7TF68_9PEZI|nr:hypothetical protein LTR62_002508 [Meristemomyces frigidus]